MRLDRQYAAIKSEIDNTTETVFTHGRVLQGPEVKKLEQDLSELYKLNHAKTLGSGTDALIFSIRALNKKNNAKIAVTSLSFIASASAIVHAGAQPVFIDIDDYYQSQEQRILELIDNNEIDGIVAVHLYGQLMDLSRIYPKAKEKGIFVIEDAAQVFGATRESQLAGQNSDATCISFDPTKVIGAYGSGGGVLTNSDMIAQSIERQRYHGHIGNRVFDSIGNNSQLPTIQAAIISVKIGHYLEWQKRRIEIANQFDETINKIEDLTAPKILQGNEHIFHKYVFRIKHRRDELATYLDDHGVSTSIHYETPLHKQPNMSAYGAKVVLPNTETATKEILSLPVYPELSDDEVRYITSKVGDFFQT